MSLKQHHIQRKPLLSTGHCGLLIIDVESILTESQMVHRYPEKEMGTPSLEAEVPPAQDTPRGLKVFRSHFPSKRSQWNLPGLCSTRSFPCGLLTLVSPFMLPRGLCEVMLFHLHLSGARWCQRKRNSPFPSVTLFSLTKLRTRKEGGVQDDRGNSKEGREGA